MVPSSRLARARRLSTHVVALVVSLAPARLVAQDAAVPTTRLSDSIISQAIVRLTPTRDSVAALFGAPVSFAVEAAAMAPTAPAGGRRWIHAPSRDGWKADVLMVGAYAGAWQGLHWVNNKGDVDKSTYLGGLIATPGRCWGGAAENVYSPGSNENSIATYAWDGFCSRRYIQHLSRAVYSAGVSYAASRVTNLSYRQASAIDIVATGIMPHMIAQWTGGLAKYGGLDKSDFIMDAWYSALPFAMTEWKISKKRGLIATAIWGGVYAYGSRYSSP